MIEQKSARRSLHIIIKTRTDNRLELDRIGSIRGTGLGIVPTPIVRGM